MHQFSITDRVTRGTIVDVLMARQTRTGEHVIIEASRPDVKLTPEIVRRLHAQQELRRTFDHPNVIRRASQFFSKERRQCWVSEPFRGESLRQRLKTGRFFRLDELIIFSMSLCDALSYLHARDVVHGSVSPEYIFLDTDRIPVSAKLLDSSLTLLRIDSKQLVSPTRLLVRPEYLAPERVTGKRASEASDIYSLGAVIFELAAAVAPFVHDDDEALKKMHLSTAPPPLPAGFKSLQMIVHRCLAKDPRKRLASAANVKEELNELHRALSKASASSREPQLTALPLRQSSAPQLRSTPPKLSPPVATAPVVERVLAEAVAKAEVPLSIRQLAAADDVPVLNVRYRNRRLAQSDARPDGSLMTLHVAAVAPGAIGSPVRIHVTVDDLCRQFALQGRIMVVLPQIVGRPAGFILSFEGADKRAVAEFLAVCADRPASMGTATSERVETKLKCAVRVGLKRRSAKVHDLSRTGAFLEVKSLVGINLGDRIRVRLVRGLFGMWGSWVTARVIWRGDKNDTPGVGVRFVSEDPTDLLVVRGLYDSMRDRRSQA